jgi:hypothetical protein
MAQNNVLMLTVAVTVATAVVEVLVVLGRKQLTADLFHIEGAEAAVARRHFRRNRLRQPNASFLSLAPKPSSCRLPVRKRSARHI